jgi:DNA-binding winged helix-turn-helix (wHTH) protein/tetratricopeptide (TPR) repeat protein
MSASIDHRNRLILGNIVFDPGTCHLIDQEGRPIALREQSLRVLSELAAKNGETVEKDDLVNAVWARISVSDDSLVQCIRNIRSVLGDSNKQLLRTAVGKGYSLHGVRELPVSPDSRPMLLISALHVRGDTPELVEMAEVVTEELIIAHSSRSGIRVITDETRRQNALYAINGRAAHVGENFRVFVQVVRGQSSEVVYAKTWNIPFNEADALPRKITDQIGNVLRVHMITYAGEDYIARDNADLNTQELMAKAAYHMARFQTHNWDAARTALSLVVERDQSNAMALAMRASMATQMIPHVAFAKIPDDYEYCFELVNRAVEVAPQIDFVVRMRGNLRMWLRADHEGAQADFKRALEINPTFFLADLALATSQFFCRDYISSIARFKNLMELTTPLDGQYPLYLSFLALGQLLSGDADAGLQSARECHERAPVDPWCSYVFATVAADREKITGTEQFRRLIVGIDLPLTHFRDLPFANIRDVEFLEERLTLIGFPRSS